MGLKCDVCGLEASENQGFAREAIPLCRTKTYCRNCHARLYRRVFQIILAASALMGVVGFFILWKHPSSSAGQVLFNLFLLQAFSFAAILPHELVHGFMARL